MTNRRGKNWKQWKILFSWAPKSLQMVTAAMKLKDTCFLGGASYDKPRQYIKKQRYCFADSGLSSQSYGFSRSHVKRSPECQRIDAFELWCWKRLMRVPWTDRRSN